MENGFALQRSHRLTESIALHVVREDMPEFGTTNMTNIVIQWIQGFIKF